MDSRDDPSTTTTTTDCDSGDSEGVDYVYEGQRSAEKRTAKAKSPRRRKSPKAKTRSPIKCVCGRSRVDDDAEITVFEEDTDTEEEQGHHSHPTKPRPSGPSGTLGCDERGHRKADRRRKTAEKKVPRAQSPYIEEYPDEAPRPAILLKEHKVPRRASTSDAKRVRNSEDRSWSSGSRGRSPTGKGLPPRAPRRRLSKESPKQPVKHKRRLEFNQDNLSDPDVGSFKSDSGEPDPPTARHARREHGPELASMAVRSSAWNDKQQPRYSSSWPLQAGSHLPRRQSTRREIEYDSDDESEVEAHPFDDGSKFDEHHRLRTTQAPSFQERALPVRERERDHQQRDTPERSHYRQHELERSIPPPRARPRNIDSGANMGTMDQGRRSAATSVCEVWRGQQDDWESPYASGSDGFDSDTNEPARLLRLEDLPPRTSSPSLLPPRGGERRDFGFQALTRPPPPPPSYAPSRYMRDPSPGPVLPCFGTYQTQAWASPNGFFLLDDGPPVLTMEPEMMDEEEEEDTWPQPSLAAWSRPTRGSRRTYPPARPPRPREVSPVFSARLTREFLSPKPTRAARFDFHAWGCDRASRSALDLGLL